MITKKEALELTIELWTWIEKEQRKNPDIKICKEHWPRWAFNGGDVPKMILDCACCEYAKNESKIKNGSIRICKSCPLNNFWTSFNCITCVSYRSPYEKWFRDRTADDAQLIANGAMKELEKLKKEE